MEVRRESGAYLKRCRLAAGLTQTQLAERVGIKFHTAISQLENGVGFVCPDRYEAFAAAPGVPLDEFVQERLQFSNPWAHAILFGDKAALKRLADEASARRMNGGTRGG